MRRTAALIAAALLEIGAIASSLWGQADSVVCEGNTAEVTTCLVEQSKKAEANLAGVYGQALKVAAQYGSKDVIRLKDAQRKWTGYRDAACEAEFALYQGGTAGGPANLPA
ncbi:MAG TPA: lysozyme inhibitor LprI family protein [Bryobacteraceae bacterium]|nr:lysozyme inhibitor LprI family protein [Bryobacteraceae bacterium]